MAGMLFDEIVKIEKMNPYHGRDGRFTTAQAATSFTYKPGASTAHDRAIEREKERNGETRSFKGTLYHGSPATDIEEFDMNRAGQNTSSGEKLLFFTDSKQMAEDFSYERLEGSSKFFQRRGEKGRVYEVDVEMKNALDLRNLSEKDIGNLMKLDVEGILTKEIAVELSGKNNQLLKTYLNLTAASLSSLGYDGLIANTGKAGHNSVEYAVVDSKQAKIRKGVSKTFDEIVESADLTPDEEHDMVVKTWTDADGIYAEDVEKGNPYHDPKTGRFTTGPGGSSMIRQGPPPKNTKIAYKLFVAKNGKLYPPMVANPDGQDTPVGVWLDAAEGKLATDKDGNPITNTLGRNKVKAGGKGTQGGSGTLAYRPGWHLGEVPEAKQFYTKDKVTGEKLQKKNFVWAECEIAADFNYQEEAMSYGYNKNGKFQHSLAGLPKIPTDGYYTYRTNPDPSTQPWYITGAMKVNRLLTDAETNAILRSHGIEPMKRDGGELDLAALGFAETNFVGKSAPAEKFDEEDKMEKSDKDKSVLFIGLKIKGAKDLAIKGGEDPDDFHVTLAYGYFNGRQHDESAIDSIVKRAIDAVRNAIPDTIRFDAIGRFKASESSDGKDVIYAQVAAGQLEEAHDYLLHSLKENGLALEVTFPEYKPHMTLAYIDPDEEYELTDIDASGTTTTVMIGYGQKSSHETSYTITKTDDDKRLVFGWASISYTVDGEQLLDRQQDMIDPEDLEEAVYEYVLNFRDTGEEHIPTMRKKGKLVESCVLTEEKQRAMGIPAGTLPIGWWIGFKIEDDDAWERVKNGTYRMFSIEGKANREPVEKSHEEEREEKVAKTFNEILGVHSTTRTIEKNHPDRFDHIEEVEKSGDFDHLVEVEKFNPYHGKDGRFASANSATSFTYAPGKSNAHDLAIARAAAKDKVSKAKEAEPALTKMMQGCATAAGGEMVGLDFCVKGEGSLTRKIKTEMSENGSDVKAALARMRDVNRYTMQLGEDNFVSGFESTMKTLQSQGHEVVRVKNTLGDPNAPYRGVNTNIKAPDGSIWELQFHTAKSLEIKEVNHKLYETQRLDKTPAAKRAELGRQMAENAASIPSPAGIEKIAAVNKL